jgi:hypothetical protein
MVARQKVVDFVEWRRVFDSHAEAQTAAGLRLKQLLRNIDDPNDVFVFFEVDDLKAARGFVTSPDVPEAKRQSGVIGDTQIHILTDES